MKNLEVGNMIRYQFSFSDNNYYEEIIKITNKYIITNKTKFNKDTLRGIGRYNKCHIEEIIDSNLIRI